MVTIGLTGNVGAGKSTVAGFWKNERGAVVIDADHLGREAVKPGNKTLALLVDRFGKEILLPDGSLDRSLMGQIAFSEPGKPRGAQRDSTSGDCPADQRRA